ncbi:MAG: hypothetical protein PHQ58_23110 [Rhodoferax sp.]|uniref:hypothetical protein n=1 Tax=Rhodoferax sp. TaxID=50421 RepID=UPI0026156790|nr:hypothetical protein [Rhodoferax sp.]MDD2883310.1 hypothetical protein [Rhodoferax sp.]
MGTPGQEYWPKWGVGLLLLASAWSSQAGLFDKLTGSGKPGFVELNDNTNQADAFKQAFSDTAVPEEIRPRKIAIGAFQIEFVTSHRGASDSGETKAEKTYTLKGITPVQMQNITEKMHREFAALLTQRGYEVLPASVLQSTSFKTELAVPNEGPVVVDDTGSITDLANTAGLISQKGETHMASVTATAKGTAPNVFERKFLVLPVARNAANEAGMAVMQVRLKLNFMQFDEGGGFGFAKIEGKPRNTLASKDSRIEVFWPTSKSAQFALKVPVVLPGGVAEKITELDMSTGEKAAVVAKGLFGAANSLLGFGASSNGGAARFVAGSTMTQVDTAASVGQTVYSAANSGKFEVTADPDYEEKVGKDLALVLQLYAQALPK